MGSRLDDDYWDSMECGDEDCECHGSCEDVCCDDVATEVELEDTGRTRTPKCTGCGAYVGHYAGCEGE